LPGFACNGQVSAASSQKYFSESASKRSYTMAKPNFNFVKRQKELEKKKKNEEKLQRKLDKKSSSTAEENDRPAGEEEAF
jgi:hypothetical protein